MVYGVAKQSGGRAEIESAEGAGTAISMLFNAVDRADDVAELTVAEADPAKERTFFLSTTRRRFASSPTQCWKVLVIKCWGWGAKRPQSRLFRALLPTF
jgi:hypothetical protein